MMASMWGKKLLISLFGESHGPAIGVVIDGLPAGEQIDFEEVRLAMNRRLAHDTAICTSRVEPDKFKVVSGIKNGYTTGSPVAAIINNEDISSKDYDFTSTILRPGHADYVSLVKHHGYADLAGGGHFSGRLTSLLTLAGAICRQLLARKGVQIAGHILSIGNVSDNSFNLINPGIGLINKLSLMNFAVINPQIECKMRGAIIAAKAEGDSVGGVIECAAVGVPVGVGEPIFDGIESSISSLVFGIPGVRGIEFGAGFAAAKMKGSEHNDAFIIEENRIRTKSNNHGGVLGGISSSMPIVFRVAIKPTPSIKKPQKTLNIKTGKEEQLELCGRHDPCIVPRAVVVIESALAISLLDLMLGNT